MDRNAFDGIFAEYAPRVRAYLVRHGLAASVAEELTQDVMLVLWRENARFDPGKGSMSTWIFTIARNRLIDSVRRGRRPAPDPEDPCWVGDRDVRATSPEAASALGERVGALRAAFARLPEEQRRVLEALYFEGQSMSEHAEASSVPLGTVKTRARLALRALREQIRGGNEE